MKTSEKKLAEAKAVLQALGLPRAQQNPNAVYTLLAFADIGPTAAWLEAEAPRRNPHEVIAFASDVYGKKYAENTRETIRRQAIHQLVQAGVLVRNPDAPDLPTNSPRTHYALTDEALSVLHAYGTPGFEAAAAAFKEAHEGGLAERYAGARRAAGHAVEIDGEVVVLSPGDHNQLQVQIVEELRPRFAPGARLLYLGDTDQKSKVVKTELLAELGVPLTQHDKLPDVVLHDERRGWLFLIEAVTSHGPVSPKRHVELEEAFGSSKLGRVYISAFLSFREFKKHADTIAWETEVWIAEAPGHMLHFNGDRFMGPRT